MGMAQRIPTDELKVSEEAKERLGSARARDIGFIIKQRLGRSGPSEDVDMIVEMILDAEGRHQPLTPNDVLQKLREKGRSPHRAEQLTALLFK